MDQRIDNTYAALQSSMRGMLAKSTWDKITIQDLCTNAGVSRTTFYTHFKDKEDLLDSLLLMFEGAMLTDNNSRSLSKTGTFRFLPILLNHVHGNRQLFAKTNSSIGGYPVATRFVKMIGKLVEAEINEAPGLRNTNSVTQHFIAGGIYNALVKWSASSDDTTHLSILNDIDGQIKQLLCSERV